MQHFSKILCFCGLLLLISCKQQSPIEKSEKNVAPISIKGLQNRIYNANLTFEKKLQGTENYKADLFSYHSDSLKIYALVNTPTIEKPEKGFRP